MKIKDLPFPTTSFSKCSTKSLNDIKLRLKEFCSRPYDPYASPHVCIRVHHTAFDKVIVKALHPYRTVIGWLKNTVPDYLSTDGGRNHKYRRRWCKHMIEQIEKNPTEASQMRLSTKEQAQIDRAIKLIRDMGCAIVVWLPHEIPNDVDIDDLEETMIVRGHDFMGTSSE